MAPTPTVNVFSEQWDESNVYIIPYSSPEFAPLAKALAGASVVRDFDDLFRFGFILRNGTGKRIIAYGARWELTDGSGKMRPRGAHTIDSGNPTGPSSIASGHDRIVTPVPGLSTYKAPKAALLQELKIQFLNNFENQARVDVRLVAVIFEDGTLVGPDLYDWGTRVQATWDAAQDLYAQLAAALDSGGVSALSAKLAEIAARPKPAPKSPGVWNKEDRHNHEFWVTQRSKAGLYAYALTNSGPDSIVRKVRTRALVRYPTIHR